MCEKGGIERVTYVLFIKQASSPCWELTIVINVSGPSSKTLDSLKNRFPLLPSSFRESVAGSASLSAIFTLLNMS